MKSEGQGELMFAGHGLWTVCLASLSPDLIRPRLGLAAHFCSPWSWVSLGTSGLAQPHSPALLAAAHTGRGGGGWAAAWTPAPLPCLAGPGRLGLLLGWEQEAVAALEGGGYPGAESQGGCRDQRELNVIPL